MSPHRPAQRHLAVRLRSALLAVVVAALVATGCGADDATGAAEPSGSEAAAPAGDDPEGVAVVDGARSTPTPQLPVTVESADGRTVTVEDVSRIVPLWGNVAEVVFSLGLGDNVVGRDTSATFPEAAHLPLVTRAHDVSAESVLSLRPTVVLADTESGPPEALDHIRNVGIPVVVVERPTSIEGIGDGIRAVAAALGVPDAGDALVAATEAELDGVVGEVPDPEDRPRVAFLYLRGTAGVYLIGGPGAGTDSMIEAAGGVDAGTAMGLDDPFTPLTSEAMAQAAPEVILVTTSGLDSVGGIDGLVEIPGIAQTPAGRDRRVVSVEDGLLFSFGSRTPDTVRQLAGLLAAS